MTPTRRTLALLRRLGATAVVVEHWNQFARRRVDLFGCIDIVARAGDAMLLIQATSGSHHAARQAKIDAIIAIENNYIAWLIARGASMEVWSWARRGKRKVWTPRRTVRTPDGWRDTPCATTKDLRLVEQPANPDCRRCLMFSEELLRVRTGQHGAAAELESISIEMGLGRAPRSGVVSAAVRALLRTKSQA